MKKKMTTKYLCDIEYEVKYSPRYKEFSAYFIATVNDQGIWCSIVNGTIEIVVSYTLYTISRD